MSHDGRTPLRNVMKRLLNETLFPIAVLRLENTLAKGLNGKNFRQYTVVTVQQMARKAFCTCVTRFSKMQMESGSILLWFKNK